VSHRFAGPQELAGRRVLVVGGSYSAFEAVLRSVEAGADVVQSYRRPEFRRRGPRGDLLSRRVRELAAAGRIELLASTTPVAIEPERVWLVDADGCRRAVPADRVLLLTGYHADLSLVSRVGGRSARPIRDWRTLETDVPGLYVAGSASTGGGPWPGFISTSHAHAACIAAHILGEPPPRGAQRRRPDFGYEPDAAARRLSRAARRLAKRVRRLSKRSRRAARRALRRLLA
jgi:thioredoxin reductase (NADPH)